MCRAELELEQLPAAGGELVAPERPLGDLRRLSDVPIDLTVEIGRTRMTVGETLELRQGSILTLNRMAGEPVDLLVNGTPIARGEVVVIDEQFGVRITDVLGHTPAGRCRAPAERRRGSHPQSRRSLGRASSQAFTPLVRPELKLCPKRRRTEYGSAARRVVARQTASGGSTCRTKATRGS